MILKKPYAFFIKYFRLIHILLTIFLGVIGFYYIKIFQFFNIYIANGYRSVSTYQLTDTYLPFYLIVLAIISFLLLIICDVLLGYKKKPRTLYLIATLYIAIILFLLFYIRGVFATLESGLIEATFSRALRDILIILFIPLPIITFILLIRSIGFNVKQFEFKNDLKDFNVDLGDSEEVEISFGADSYKVKRNLHKYFREFKYYFAENKFFVFIIIVCIIVLGIIFALSFRTPNYNRNYRENVSFVYKRFMVNIEDSMITNVDYRGSIIKEGKYFLVIKLNVTNNDRVNLNFDSNFFKLSMNDRTISPVNGYNDNFVDFVSSKNVSVIKKGESITKLLVYELNTKEINGSYRLKMEDGTVTNNDATYNKFVEVVLNPDVVDQIDDTYNFNLNDSIEINKGLLKGNTLKISSYDIAKGFDYSYVKKIDDEEKTFKGRVAVSPLHNHQDNSLIKFEGEYQNTSSSIKSLKSVIGKFGSVEFVKNGVAKTALLTDVTPDDYTDGLIFEIDGNALNSEKIDLILTFRNIRYIIALK